MMFFGEVPCSECSSEESQLGTMGEQGVCPENFDTIGGSTAGRGQSLIFTNLCVPAGQQMYEIETAQLLV